MAPHAVTRLGGLAVWRVESRAAGPLLFARLSWLSMMASFLSPLQFFPDHFPHQLPQRLLLVRHPWPWEHDGRGKTMRCQEIRAGALRSCFASRTGAWSPRQLL